VLLAVVTGGLARAGGGQLAALTLTAAVGTVAAAGAVLDGMEVRAGASPHVIVGCRAGAGPGW
jgi:hypothetical protein